MEEASREEIDHVSTILDDAKEAIESHTEYGSPTANHERIAYLWNIFIDYKSTDGISPKDVMAMMILVKISRIMETPEHKDSIVDIAGYAALLGSALRE